MLSTEASDDDGSSSHEDNCVPLLLNDGLLLLQNNKSKETIGTVKNWLGVDERHVRRKLGGKTTLIFTLGTVCLSYMGFFGVFFNIVVFFISFLDSSNATAANNANYWLGTQFVCAIFGAFVAEAFLGRLWTCAIFLLVNCLGMVAMAGTMTLLASGGAGRGWFYGTMYVVAMGMGAFQPALQATGADQFTEESDKSLFFTWYLVFDNVGMVLADTLLVYVMTNVSWVVGFWVCAILSTGAALLFILGLSFFRQLPRHSSNPYTHALCVFVASIRNLNVPAPCDPSLLYSYSLSSLPHTQSWRFLDKAATITEENQKEPRDPWRLCTMKQVEEVKQVLRLLPIWACNIIFYTIYAQGGTFFVEQGLLLDGNLGDHFHMAAATMNLFNLAAVIVGPAIYDVTRHPSSPLRRMAVGFFLSAVAMAMAATLEAARLRSVATPLSIFWQVPQYFTLGVAQFLGAVAQLEFFYSEAPESLRSLGSSLYGTAIAAGNYASSLLVLVVNAATWAQPWIPRDLDRGHLDYFFALLALLATLDLLFFLYCVSSFKSTKQDHITVNQVES